MNADKLGITDRGRLKEELAADAVVLDQDRVIDRATFERRYQFPRGITYVIVSGVVTVNNEHRRGALAGPVLSMGPCKRRCLLSADESERRGDRVVI
jgi:N-acyl-D-aspartate/D-glutamate deacylase